MFYVEWTSAVDVLVLREYSGNVSFVIGLDSTAALHSSTEAKLHYENHNFDKIFWCTVRFKWNLWIELFTNKTVARKTVAQMFRSSWFVICRFLLSKELWSHSSSSSSFCFSVTYTLRSRSVLRGTERFPLTGFLRLSIRICHLTTWRSVTAYFLAGLFLLRKCLEVLSNTWEFHTKHWVWSLNFLWK